MIAVGSVEEPIARYRSTSGSAARWALTEQARRLADRVAEMTGRV